MGWTCGFWAESKLSQTSIHAFIPQLCQPILSWRSHSQRKSGPKFQIPNSEAGNICKDNYDKIREDFHGQFFLPGYSSCHSGMPTSIPILWNTLMAFCCAYATGKRHYFIRNGLQKEHIANPTSPPHPRGIHQNKKIWTRSSCESQPEPGVTTPL